MAKTRCRPARSPHSPPHQSPREADAVNLPTVRPLSKYRANKRRTCQSLRRSRQIERDSGEFSVYLPAAWTYAVHPTPRQSKTCYIHSSANFETHCSARLHRVARGIARRQRKDRPPRHRGAASTRDRVQDSKATSIVYLSARSTEPVSYDMRSEESRRPLTEQVTTDPILPLYSKTLQRKSPRLAPTRFEMASTESTPCRKR